MFPSGLIVKFDAFPLDVFRFRILVIKNKSNLLIKIYAIINGATTFSIMAITIMTLSIMTFVIKRLSIMTFVIMTLNIMTISIMSLKIMIFAIMTLSIMTLSVV